MKLKLFSTKLPGFLITAMRFSYCGKGAGGNFNIARQILEWLRRKFYGNHKLYGQYSEIIKDYLNEGIIEQVEGSESISNKPIFYLPHHAIYKEDKLTTNVRTVFDASSHDTNELSLNDCLWLGPNFNPLLFDILVQFRLNQFYLRSLKFKRVLFVVNAPPYLLSATTKRYIEQFRDEYPRTIYFLDQYICVDDFPYSKDILQDAFEVVLHEKNNV